MLGELTNFRLFVSELIVDVSVGVFTKILNRFQVFTLADSLIDESVLSEKLDIGAENLILPFGFVS